MLALLDPMYYEVSVSVQRGAIVFLGTPHRGSDLAGTLNRLLSITIGFKSFVRELMANSSTLESINEEFRHCSKNLKLWSFYETQPTSTGPGRSSVRKPPLYVITALVFTLDRGPKMTVSYRLLWRELRLSLVMTTRVRLLLMRIITQFANMNPQKTQVT